MTFKTKENNTSRPLELVHTDLCGPTRTRALAGERYFMLLIDDFLRMTWVTFLHDKSQAFERFKIFWKMVERESGCKLKCLRYDQGGEFTSNEFQKYYERHGIRRQYSAPWTPQKNGVVERKKWTLKEMARTMLNEENIPDMYWKEAVHTTIYTLKWVQLRTNNRITPYELWYDRKPPVKYFKVFGRKCFIERDEDGLGGFDSRSDEGIFLGYSNHNKAYKCYNKRLRRVIESIHIRVDEDMHKGRQAKVNRHDD